MTIHSMTGYAVTAKETSAGTVTIELKSVNSRFLDLQFRINDELRMVEPALREELEGALGAGETLAALVEKAVRSEVERRRGQAEFVRRGLAAVARSEAAGDWSPAETVLARLEAKVAAARKRSKTSSRA